MESFINLILISGKKGVDLVFYILLPIMVIMMAFMRYLEYKGILGKIAYWLSPVLIIFGLPGMGVFAALQILFISFAAPLSTLAITEKDAHLEKRKIAATLAMIFTMSQANAVFPLATKGLNIPMVWLSSLIGGLIAAALVFYFFANKQQFKQEKGEEIHIQTKPKEKIGILKLIMQGGEEGVNMILKALPMLIFAILFVNLFKELGVIKFLGNTFSPILGVFDIKGEAMLPIVTKFLAGGTAMMGVAMEMLDNATLTPLELNKIAGLMIHPFDLMGLALYPMAGERTASIMRPAIYGALIGIAIRAVFHLIVF